MPHFTIKSPSVRSYTPERVSVNTDTWYNSQKSQREWSLRLSREFEYILNVIHGSVLFVTFTFDEEHLPYLSFADKVYCDDKGKKVKCFDNERLSETVIRVLRQTFGYKFKYIVFPEYGSDDLYIDDRGRVRRATSRPHYHVLFFFETVVNDSKFHKLLCELWSACRFDNLKVLPITENYGFSTYVSKYVSKGYEKKKFPVSFFSDIENARLVIRRFRDVPLDSLCLLDKARLERAAELLCYYETHRPKVLCSNGIGLSIPYTDKEIYDRSCKVFYGKKYHDLPVPSYNIRKANFDSDSHLVRCYWKRDGKKIVPVKDYSLRRYHWTINEIGLKNRLHYDELDYNLLCDELNVCLNANGQIKHEHYDYFHKHGLYDLDDYTDWSQVSEYLCSQLIQLFGTTKINRHLFIYRKVWFRYSKEHLQRFFGSACSFVPTAKSPYDYVNLRRDFDEMLKVGSVLYDNLYEFDNDFIRNSFSCGHSTFYDNILVFDILSQLNDHFNNISAALAAAEWHERRMATEAQRKAARQHIAAMRYHIDNIDNIDNLK